MTAGRGFKWLFATGALSVVTSAPALAAGEKTPWHSYAVPWYMYAALAMVMVAYAVIEAKHTRHDHEITFPEAVKWTIFYVAAGLLFAVPILQTLGTQAATEYVAAWAIEKALSMDNLFVISLIFTSFSVHPSLQRRMLNYGIAGAILFRLIFIMGGLELLKHFSWFSAVFGLILLRGAWKTFQDARGTAEMEEEVEITDQKLWKMITRHLPIHHEFDGHKLITWINSRRKLTLMAAIIILIELTDVIFAVDSVPAVLAISPDRFVAYASNVFAILGLRALFFVYQSVADKFWALSWGLTGVLAWIGFKMVATPFGLHIAVGPSLAVLGVLLGGSILVSMLWPRKAVIERIEIETPESLASPVEVG